MVAAFLVATCVMLATMFLYGENRYLEGRRDGMAEESARRDTDNERLRMMLHAVWLMTDVNRCESCPVYCPYEFSPGMCVIEEQMEDLGVDVPDVADGCRHKQVDAW